ncbi:hypothetical protein [Streptomyces noursei]|uniref:hypothetical protein n=1 Tax=Streptomyces noursei TaxID=1971 RepID=UPI00167672CB|nr:hypothetical protein [Streptomyces noursei]MCZ1015599.1 hypothetical protein [Streptomyces noursei]GGW89383.1 hypothetical protein GCM10010341_07720 [Streptomyces noursei]
MTSLPSNSELKKLHLQGFSDEEIAERYQVTRQAVNKRMVSMDIRRKPTIATKANSLIPWDVKTVQYGGGTHHTAYPLEGLKLYLRKLMGDESLTSRQQADAGRFERRLLKNPHLVLDYNRDTEKGFFWRDRCPEDADLIVAWPEGKAKPPVEDLNLLKMPAAGDAGGGGAA